jgi:hypothetical protein
MSTDRWLRCALGIGLIAAALSAATAQQVTAPAVPELRDGQHDFDFNFGVWRTHIRRLKEPVTGTPEYVEMNGTVAVRKVWDGRAQLEEIEVDAPTGHWQGLTLFLYDPKAHQWSQTFVNSAVGTLSGGTIGEFKDGRGELYAQDTRGRRSVLVRGVWSDIKPNSHRYEEAYSDDGGRTWTSYFIADLTRAQP